MGVSLNGATPKPMVVGYHHFRKPPYATLIGQNDYVVFVSPLRGHKQ